MTLLILILAGISLSLGQSVMKHAFEIWSFLAILVATSITLHLWQTLLCTILGWVVMQMLHATMAGHGSSTRPGTGPGCKGYFSATSRLENGQRFLDRSVEAISEVLKQQCDTPDH